MIIFWWIGLKGQHLDEIEIYFLVTFGQFNGHFEEEKHLPDHKLLNGSVWGG